jgi:hypothetical protein
MHPGEKKSCGKYSLRISLISRTTMLVLLAGVMLMAVHRAYAQRIVDEYNLGATDTALANPVEATYVPGSTLPFLFAAQNGGPFGGGGIGAADDEGDEEDYYDADPDSSTDGYDPVNFWLETAAQLVYLVNGEGSANHCGSLDQLDLTTKVTTPLYLFGSEPTDVCLPINVVLGNGVLYGTAQGGGKNGLGGAWSYNLSTKNYSVLYSLSTMDGTGPGPVLYDRGFLFFGINGGSINGGALKKINLKTGKATTVASFPVGGTPGWGPIGPLASDNSRNFHMAFEYGGAYGYGCVAELSSSGLLTDEHDFGGLTLGDGSSPYGLVYNAGSGTVVGTTYAGGTSSHCSAGCGGAYVFNLNTSAYAFFSLNGANGIGPVYPPYVLYDAPKLALGLWFANTSGGKYNSGAYVNLRYDLP